METRKRNKREREIEERFNYSHLTTLEQCYGCFSEAKRQAFEGCRNLHAMLDDGLLYTYSYRIISYSGFVFITKKKIKRKMRQNDGFYTAQVNAPRLGKFVTYDF